MKVTLALLTLNEIEGVKAIVPRIPKSALFEIFCVDGGSNDGTTEWLTENGIRVVRQKNRSRADAVRVALDESKGDAIIYFSPDGNEVPEDIPKLIAKAEEGYDLVIASRFARGGGSEDAGFVHTIGNKALTFFANLFFGMRLTDTINGFRLIRNSVLREIGYDAKRHEGDMEMTLRAAKKGCKIAEIPTIEPKRIGGKAKIKTLTDGWLYFKTIFKERFRG